MGWSGVVGWLCRCGWWGGGVDCCGVEEGGEVVYEGEELGGERWGVGLWVGWVGGCGCGEGLSLLWIGRVLVYLFEAGEFGVESVLPGEVVEAGHD